MLKTSFLCIYEIVIEQFCDTVEANVSVSMQHKQCAFDSRTEWTSTSLIGICDAFDVIIIIIIINEFHRDASLTKNFRAAVCHVFHKRQWYCCR